MMMKVEQLKSKYQMDSDQKIAEGNLHLLKTKI